jgi:hypothetical protein
MRGLAGKTRRAANTPTETEAIGMETMRGQRRLRPVQRVELNLPRASHRSMARQRARAHPEAWRKWRRHVVKRSATIAATILRRAFHAQPVAARRTIRIQTLHRPTGQILHSFASQNPRPGRRKGKRLPPGRPVCKSAKTGAIVRRRL